MFLCGKKKKREGGRKKDGERGKKRERRKGEGNKTQRKLSLIESVFFLHGYSSYRKKTRKVFKVLLKIEHYKIQLGAEIRRNHLFFYVFQYMEIWKKNHFFDSRGRRIVFIFKSYIYKLSKSTVGCHVADANLRATLNFPAHIHSFWMHLGALCSNSEGWHQSHYLLKDSYLATKTCICHFSGGRLHKVQVCEKTHDNTAGTQILKKIYQLLGMNRRSIWKILIIKDN